MKKRIILCATLLALFMGQADAKGYKRPTVGAKKTSRIKSKTSRAGNKKQSTKSKLPKNLDEVYGPSILVARFDAIAEAKSTVDSESTSGR